MGARIRTFGATFRTSLILQIRGYTLTGWFIVSTLSPILLFAGAWVTLRLLGAGVAPAQFLKATGYPSYLAFVVLGVAFQGLAQSALEDGGNAVYDEESNGTWDLLELAPFSRFAWMLGKTLAGLVAGFVDFAVVLAIGAVAFGTVPTPEGLAIAVLGVVVTVLALQGFAFTMAAVGLRWKQPMQVAYLLSPFFILFSGMMFPVSTLPAWAQPISQAIPLTHGLVIIRDAILLNRPLGALLPQFGLLVLTGGILMVIGYSSFRRMERVARATGVMGRY
ncbi:MAG: ABC transporter permease [Thermoplasmatota archaeon]